MKWMVCIKNQGYAASLELRKLYPALDDDKSEAMGLLRIIDESGDDYLYPQDMFRPMTVGKPLEEHLLTI